MYRPKGRLARTLYYKAQMDEELRNYDKRLWYTVDISRLSQDLHSKFVQLDLDEEGSTFLKHSEEKSSWLFTQLWHSFVKSVLGLFLTQTSINGLLHRGSMFVFSLQQFLSLASPNENASSKPARLLDLGAGDGAVTSVIDKLYDEVYVTEVSQPMKWTLASKGYKVLEVETWANSGIRFDTVLCMNLLDRCDRPLDILADITRVLNPNGTLVLALVLPFKPYVEIGNDDHIPSQSLFIRGQEFEDHVASLVENVLTPAGFTVVKWSRVPYLCEGDLQQAYYWLDDVLLVLKLTSSLNT